MTDYDAPDQLCFFCSNPAVVERRLRLSSASDQDMIDYLRNPQPIRSQMFIGAYACAAHEAGLSDALMDAVPSVGSVSGDPTPWKLAHPDECPDPFHHDPDNHGEEVVFDSGRTSDGKGHWVGMGYRCPTCGFQTAQLVAHVDDEDPAYKFARAALAKVNGPDDEQ